MSKVGSVGPAVREGRGEEINSLLYSLKSTAAAAEFKEMQNLIYQFHCVFEIVHISTLSSSLQSKKIEPTSLNWNMCFLYCA